MMTVSSSLSKNLSQRQQQPLVRFLPFFVAISFLTLICSVIFAVRLSIIYSSESFHNDPINIDDPNSDGSGLSAVAISTIVNKAVGNYFKHHPVPDINNIQNQISQQVSSQVASQVSQLDFKKQIAPIVSSTITKSLNEFQQSSPQSPLTIAKSVQYAQSGFVWDPSYLKYLDQSSGQYGARVQKKSTSSPYLGKSSKSSGGLKSLLNRFSQPHIPMAPVVLSRRFKDLYLGNCWAFQGSKGSLSLKLSSRSKIIAVSLTSMVSPNSDIFGSQLDSTPKSFNIFTQINGKSVQLNSSPFHFTAAQSKPNGRPVSQMFPLDNNKLVETDNIRFEFISNYGQPDYTCVYRVGAYSSE